MHICTSFVQNLTDSFGFHEHLHAQNAETGELRWGKGVGQVNVPHAACPLCNSMGENQVFTPPAPPSTVLQSLCSHFQYGNTSSAVRPPPFIIISDFMVGETPGKGVARYCYPCCEAQWAAP